MYVNNIKIPITKDILNAVSAYIIHIFQVTTRSRITMPVQVHVNTGIPVPYARTTRYSNYTCSIVKKKIL